MKTKVYKFNGSNNTLSHTLNVYFLSTLSSMQVRTVTNSHISPLKITKKHLSTLCTHVRLYLTTLVLALRVGTLSLLWDHQYQHKFFPLCAMTFLVYLNRKANLQTTFQVPYSLSASFLLLRGILNIDLQLFSATAWALRSRVAHSVYLTATRPTEV
jgi:hypothetical protein